MKVQYSMLWVVQDAVRAVAKLFQRASVSAN